MELPHQLALLGIPLLLAASGLLSMSETALTGANRARLHQRRSDGSKRAARVLGLLETPEHPLGAILIGNNLANILASSLATYALIGAMGDAGVLVASLGMTLLIVVFCEIAPKTYALSRPNETALWVSMPIRMLVLMLRPLLLLTRQLTAGILSLFRIPENAPREGAEARDEILGAIDLGHLSGAFLREHRDMMVAALELERGEVSDVMTSRGKVEMLDADAAPDELLEACLASSHSRLPLFHGGRDSIVGVVHARDLFREIHRLRQSAEGLAEFSVRTIASGPWFVPESRSLADQLRAFQSRKQQLALVVDEFGDFQGVVTLEDVVEDIVGDIVDEHDRETPGVSPTGDGGFVVDGSATIRELNRLQRWRLPDEDATTIAGLVIHEAGAIPSTGQEFDFHGFRFQVLECKRNRLLRLLVRPLRESNGKQLAPLSPAAERDPPAQQP